MPRSQVVSMTPFINEGTMDIGPKLLGSKQYFFSTRVTCTYLLIHNNQDICATFETPIKINKCLGNKLIECILLHVFLQIHYRFDLVVISKEH